MYEGCSSNKVIQKNKIERQSKSAKMKDFYIDYYLKGFKGNLKQTKKEQIVKFKAIKKTREILNETIQKNENHTETPLNLRI